MDEFTQQMRFDNGLNSNPGWWQVLGLPRSLVQKCQDHRHPRTTSFLNARLQRKVPLPPIADGDVECQRFAKWNADRIADVTLRSGAIWHGSRLKWLIECSQRARLVSEIGEEVFGFALRHADLCMVDGERKDTGILIDSMREDGRRCWHHWLLSQQSAVRARLALLSPPSAPVITSWNDAQVKRGVMIVDHVLAETGALG